MATWPVQRTAAERDQHRAEAGGRQWPEGGVGRRREADSGRRAGDSGRHQAAGDGKRQEATAGKWAAMDSE